MNKVVAYFSEGYDEIFATDIGDWVMELTNTEGETYKFRGSLCADFEIDGVDLSDLVRDTLDMQDFYVFNGNNKPDKINRIVLDYNRVTKIKPKEVPEGATWEFGEVREKKRTVVGAVSSLFFLFTGKLYMERDWDARKKRAAESNTQ